MLRCHFVVYNTTVSTAFRPVEGEGRNWEWGKREGKGQLDLDICRGSRELLDTPLLIATLCDRRCLGSVGKLPNASRRNMITRRASSHARRHHARRDKTQDRHTRGRRSTLALRGRG